MSDNSSMQFILFLYLSNMFDVHKFCTGLNLNVILGISDRLASDPDSDVSHADPHGIATPSCRNSCLSLRVTLSPDRFCALINNVIIVMRSDASRRYAKNSDRGPVNIFSAVWGIVIGGD